MAVSRLGHAEGPVRDAQILFGSPVFDGCKRGKSKRTSPRSVPSVSPGPKERPSKLSSIKVSVFVHG